MDRSERPLRARFKFNVSFRLLIRVSVTIFNTQRLLTTDTTRMSVASKANTILRNVYNYNVYLHAFNSTQMRTVYLKLKERRGSEFLQIEGTSLIERVLDSLFLVKTIDYRYADKKEMSS